MDSKYSLTINSLYKSFGRLKVLDNISFDIEKNEISVIIGPSGCGKTTLLRIIASLEKADSGKISSDKQNKIGFVFQENTVFPWRTVLKNIEFGLEFKNLVKRKRKEIAKDYIRLVHLNGFENYYPYQLSCGMQQRLKLAMCLAVNPEILLMDEPFNSLDYLLRLKMQKELIDIWKKTRKTILFVTHNVDEAIYLADKIIVLSEKPAKIIENFQVKLKRPRDINSEDFISVKNRILKILKATPVNAKYQKIWTK